MAMIDASMTYAKGSIVCIEVRNFVTYTHSAIYPSSRLNLIVGPNGSGKSTVVCAMCLGLGGSPKLLERGEKAKDYVRHGETKATIEISLAKGTGKDVVVLRRTIETDLGRESEESKWWIDGRSCKKKEIDAVVSAYNIQLKNYTQFLPQDVVKMFPALTQVQLLHRTEEALEDQTLLPKHKKLIELRAAGRAKDADHGVKQQHLEELEAKQAKLQAEVEKFNEWSDLTKEIDNMKLREPWLQFETCRDKALELKALKKEAAKEYNSVFDQMNDAKAPLDEKVKEQKQLVRTPTSSSFLHKLSSGCWDLIMLRAPCMQSEEAKKLRLEKRRKDTAHGKKHDELEELEEETEKLADQLKQVDQQERKRQTKIAKLEGEITELERELSKSKGVDTSAAKKRRTALMRDKSKMVGQQREVQDKKRDVHVEIGRKRKEIARIESVKQQASNARHRVLQQVRQKNNGGGEDHFALASFIEKNKHLFQKEVYGPIAAHIAMKKPENARFVETIVDRGLRCAFVTQTVADRETLDKVIKQKQWGTSNHSSSIRTINFDPQDSRNQPQRSPVDLGRVRSYGITHYMDELFDAPEVVKKALNATSKLNQIGFGTAKAEQEKNHHAIVAAGVRAIVTPNKHVVINRSVHTQRDIARTRAPQPKAFILQQGVDTEKVAAMDQQISLLNAELEKLAAELGRVNNAEKTCTGQLEAMTTEMARLAEQIQQEQRLVQQLKTRRGKLDKALAEPDARTERERLRKEVAKANAKRIKKIAALVESMRGYMKTCAAHDLAALAEKSMSEEITQLRDVVRQLTDKADDAKREYDKIEEAYNDSRKALKDFKRKADANPVTAEMAKYWSSLPSDHYMNDLDELREEIRTQQARADGMVVGGGESVVAQYKRQAEQIESLRAEFEDSEGEKRKRLEEISNIEESWLPSLRKHIADVNASFSGGMSEMGFCGEVGLKEVREDAEDPGSAFDYERFAIDIRVSHSC